MKKWKKEKDWFDGRSQRVVVDTQFHQRSLTVSNGWFLFPFLLGIVMILITLGNYDQIPDPIPIQYNFQGQITNWIDKSYTSVLSLPATHLYLTVIFLFTNQWIIPKAKQQLHVNDPQTSREQNVLFRRSWSAFIIITSSVLSLLLFIVQLSIIFLIPVLFIWISSLLLTGGLILYALVLSFKTGQGGSRIRYASKAPQKETPFPVDCEEDQYWKLGRFYYNREDPALFVEKRFGIGWTINCARPAAWLIILIILLGITLIPIILTIL